MPKMPTKVHKVKTYGKKKPTNWLADQSHLKIYNSARWRKLRLSYMQRNPTCKTKDCTRPAYYLDHIIPIHQGGNIWDEKNLQGLCPSCNGSKTSNQKLKKLR